MDNCEEDEDEEQDLDCSDGDDSTDSEDCSISASEVKIASGQEKLINDSKMLEKC